MSSWWWVLWSSTLRVPSGWGIVNTDDLNPRPRYRRTMCLGVPGELLSITAESPLRLGRVSFSGVLKEVCLAALPEANPGDYVIVHAGFAISRLDAAAAAETLRLLDALDNAGVTPVTQNST